MEQVSSTWNLPPSLVEPISCHHGSLEQLGSIKKEERLKRVALVGVVDRLARSLLIGGEETALLEPTRGHASVLSLDPRSVAEVLARVGDTVTHVRALLASFGFTPDEPGWCRRLRVQLGDDPRPLYVSSEPALDAHALFMNQTRPYEDDQPPNVAVVLIDGDDDRTRLSQGLQTAEQEAGVSPLPLLIFSESGRVRLPGLAGGRRVCPLPSTVHGLDVADAVAALLNKKSVQRVPIG